MQMERMGCFRRCHLGKMGRIEYPWLLERTVAAAYAAAVVAAVADFFVTVKELVQAERRSLRMETIEWGRLRWQLGLYHYVGA